MEPGNRPNPKTGQHETSLRPVARPVVPEADTHSPNPGS